MKRILIIAGEASGDLHAAELIKSVKNTNPDIHFFGIGGPKMREAGAEILFDNRELAVVGIIEIIKHFKVIRNAFHLVKRILKTTPPDLVILVDYPGFNLRIAKLAARYNCKVLYFISPQLWAWRRGRIKHIKKYVNKMAVIFPFEVDFYQRYGIDAVYVGNSLIEQVKASIPKAHAYKQFNLNPACPVVALLPGSRNSEIKYIFHTLLDAATLIQQSHPTVQLVLPLAPSLDKDKIASEIKTRNLDIQLIPNQLYNLLQLSDAAVVVSGTVTLEVALMGIPFLIIYKLAPISYAIGRMLVKINHIGLCNIVAGKAIAPELIQDQATPAAIAAQISAFLSDDRQKKIMRENLQALKTEFSQKNAVEIASVVLKLMQ